MSAFWAYFWPALGIGMLCGVLAGIIAFRAPRVRVKAPQAEVDSALAGWRRRRLRAVAAGAGGAIILAALWHGPLGAADRLSSQIEQDARRILAQNDAPAGMTARVHHDPLTRQLVLSGPGDAFQQGEAARLLSETPGASTASWSRATGVPLIAEGAIAALLGFLFGLGLAYLVELRRRHNSQWTW